MELQSRYGEIEAAGGEIWAVSSDDPSRLEAFRKAEGIGYELLLDPNGETFEAYGVANERDDRTIPHPTVVVVDGEGVARYVVTDEDYRVRPPGDDVVEAVRGLSD